MIAYKILIMGLPGSGKTTFAKKLVNELSSVLWLNADQLRTKYHDWDFTNDGRLRQAQRMFNLAEETDKDFVVCDFVAPLPKSREIFDPEFIIWMDTIAKGRFDDTNRLFVTPDDDYEYRITEFNDTDLPAIVNLINSTS